MKKLLVIGLMLSACGVQANRYMNELDTDVNAVDADPTKSIGATLNESQTSMKRSQAAAVRNVHHTHKKMANDAVRNVRKQGLKNLRTANVQAMHNIDQNKRRLEAQISKLSTQHDKLSRDNAALDREIARLQ